MRCPTLAQLPLPPPGKTGWPWTIERPQLSDTMPGGTPWPRISIVTPSYNQGRFIEETIRSILLQGYPNLEYIIMDCGSSDGSIETIQKYSPWLAHWQAGPDGGQVEAINEGLKSASGTILNWINSDDFLLSCALSTIAQVFSSDAELDLYIASNLSIWTGAENNLVTGMSSYSPSIRDWLHARFGALPVAQDACFFSRSIWSTSGPLNSQYDFVFDEEFFCRAQSNARHIALGAQIVSVMNRHGDQKTRKNFLRDRPEKLQVLKEWSFPALMRRCLRSRFGGVISVASRLLIRSERAGVFVVQFREDVGFCVSKRFRMD